MTISDRSNFILDYHAPLRGGSKTILTLQYIKAKHIFQVYSIGVFHNDSSPTEQELDAIAGNKSYFVLQSAGFGGLDLKLQNILYDFCDSFTFGESSGSRDLQSIGVDDFANTLPSLPPPNYYYAEPPPPLWFGEE